LERSKKSTLCIIASHETIDPEEEIDVANCLVAEYRLKGVWRTSLKPLFVKDLVRCFLINPNSDITQATPIKPADLERLQAHWKEAIEQAPDDTKRTPALAILRSPGTRPVAADDNTIVLAFNYEIHKEQLEKAENKEIAEKIITNFLGRPCHIRCIVEPEYGCLVKAALALGAEIIDQGNYSAPAANKEAEVTMRQQPQLFIEGTKNQDTDQTMAPAEEKALPLTKTQAHIQYQLADGTIVPGVTTVLQILNKPALIQWAWDLGRQGLDWREVRDSAGDVGTLAHYLIMCTLKGETPDTSEYSQADIQKANNCLAKFKNWLKEHPVSPIMIETPLVSEEYKYGGTLDLFAEYNDEFILVDFKTGKALYDEYFYQLTAYRRLLEEQGWPVANARILRIGRDEVEGFEEVIRTNLDREFEIFKKCLEIYRLRS
jgi:hypothetical protein